jgi:hypothetical protein
LFFGVQFHVELAHEHVKYQYMTPGMHLSHFEVQNFLGACPTWMYIILNV